MSSSIGEKIKVFSVIIAILGCLVFFIDGIVLSIYDYNLAFKGFKIIAFGCLGSLIISFFFYGFGELIVQITKFAELLEKNGSVDKNNLNTPKEDE
jgi:hypothetical protein